jgi:RNA polymerase sigma factor (sigma-70 family)
MDDRQLAERFEQHRPRLRAVAYRMLGSRSEAEDAVQEAWLPASRADAAAVENLAGWLTTIVSRVSLNMLRARRSRPVEALGAHVPDPVVARLSLDGRVDAGAGTDLAADPEREALLSDAVGMALLVVLDTLTPDERVAFVLHDMFAVPFDEIAAILDASPASARQLASRARRRVRDRAPGPDAGLRAQWDVVEAFMAAARDGDLDGLLAVLHPDVVLRADAGPRGESGEVHTAQAVGRQAASYSRDGLTIHPALVAGAPGAVTVKDGRPFSIGAFTVRGGRIVRIDILADPDRLARLDLSAVTGAPGDEP